MGNSRHDLSIPKDYFMKDKAKLLYVSSSTYGGSPRPTHITVLSCSMF